MMAEGIKRIRELAAESGRGDVDFQVTGYIPLYIDDNAKAAGDDEEDAGYGDTHLRRGVGGVFGGVGGEDFEGDRGLPGGGSPWAGDEVLGGELAEVCGDDEDVCSGGYAAVCVRRLPCWGTEVVGGEWINARGARSAPVGMGVTGRAPTRSLSHKSVKHSPIGYS